MSHLDKLDEFYLIEFEKLTLLQKSEVRKLVISENMGLGPAITKVKESFDAYRDLGGGRVVKITGAYVFPSIDGLIIENKGKYYKLTSEKLIDVEEIEYNEE